MVLPLPIVSFVFSIQWNKYRYNCNMISRLESGDILYNNIILINNNINTDTIKEEIIKKINYKKTNLFIEGLDEIKEKYFIRSAIVKKYDYAMDVYAFVEISPIIGRKKTKNKLKLYDILYSLNLKGENVHNRQSLEHNLRNLYSLALQTVYNQTNNMNYKYDKQYINKLDNMFFKYFIQDFYKSNLDLVLDIKLYSDIYSKNIVNVLITFTLTKK